ADALCLRARGPAAPPGRAARARVLAGSRPLWPPATSLAFLATWAFRSSTCAWRGFRSVQPTIPATAATAAATFTTLAHFINVPFGLLIRDSLITDATPVKQVRVRRSQLHQI